MTNNPLDSSLFTLSVVDNVKKQVSNSFFPHKILENVDITIRANCRVEERYTALINVDNLQFVVDILNNSIYNSIGFNFHIAEDRKSCSINIYKKENNKIA